MERVYFAVIEAGDQEGFSVFFPDLPGCTSAGDTIEEAIEGAGEALDLHVQGMIEDKEALPTPSLPGNFDKDIEVRAVVGIPVKTLALKQRVNVTIGQDVLDELESRSLNRSRFLDQAAREKLRKAG